LSLESKFEQATKFEQLCSELREIKAKLDQLVSLVEKILEIMPEVGG